MSYYYDPQLASKMAAAQAQGYQQPPPGQQPYGGAPQYGQAPPAGGYPGYVSLYFIGLAARVLTRYSHRPANLPMEARRHSRVMANHLPSRAMGLPQQQHHQARQQTQICFSMFSRNR